MIDIIYPLSVYGELVVLLKRDFQLVAFNRSGIKIVPLSPIEEISFETEGGINYLVGVKLFADNQYKPEERSSDERGICEVQDAQIAVDLERYLHGVECSFLIEELRPLWLPIRALADVLTSNADFRIASFKPVQVAADLITHANHLLLQNLAPSQLQLPSREFKADENSPNPSIPAVRLVLNYFEQTMHAYKTIHKAEVKGRVKDLVGTNDAEFSCNTPPGATIDPSTS
jgi:hypothetical protein